MTRLIDADALKEATKELYNETLDAIVKFGIEKAYDLIDAAPAVSPFTDDILEAYSKITDQEFEHSDGFWITTPKGKKIYFEKKRPQGLWIIGFDRFSCPFCKMSFDDKVHYLYPKEYRFNYCPNCGAKMEGGVKMNENPDKKYCCICGKEIIIGVFYNASHQKYNFIAHIMGEPMFCSDCWKDIEQKGGAE